MTDIGVAKPGGRGGRDGHAGRAALLSLLLAAAGSGGGACAHPRVEARRMPAWVFESSRAERPVPPPRQARPHGGIRGRNQASDFVVAALQETGLRFGTDGSVASLWGYLRTSHTLIPGAEARPGDVLFFQTRMLPAPEGCDGRGTPPDHVGIVSIVDPDGRIAFVEARDGHVRQSYAHPERPSLRRDEEGRVLNTFLRPRRPGDPPQTPSFAGEMLCAAVRPDPR